MTISGNDSTLLGRVTVALLVQRNVPLDWHEAIAVVLEVADVMERSGQEFLPAYHDIELTSDGAIRFLKDPSGSSDALAAVSDIFRALLPTDAPEHIWTLVTTAGPDAPVYGSVSDFAAALRYFERPERRGTLRGVYRRAVDTPPPPGQRDSADYKTESALSVQLLRVEDIHVRGTARPLAADGLVASVLKHGLLQPILVRRADRGYELIAGATWLAAAKAAELTQVPCCVCDVSDEESKTLAEIDRSAPGRQESGSSHQPPDWSMALGPALGEIADSLGAAQSCWDLSSDGTARPYYRTVSDVTRVELQRSIWLVEGLRVLGERPVLNKSTQNLGSLLDRVFHATRPERRLANIRLLANLTGASIVLSGDENLLVMAYGGTLQAMLALVGQTTPAVVRCQVTTRDSVAVVEFSQDGVAVSSPLLTRFFDESYHGRPGGYSAAVSLSGAKRVMELHGGSATIEPLEPQGCRVTTTLPL